MVLVVVCVLALLGTVSVWVLRRVRRGGSPTLKSLDNGVREPLQGARRRHSSVESIEIGEQTSAFSPRQLRSIDALSLLE